MDQRHNIPMENPQSLLNLAVGLTALRSTQAIVSGMVEGALPGPEGPTKDQVRTYFMCLMVETIELMNELNWKPWKQPREVDKDRVIDEFADILAFTGLILNYLNALGITDADLARAYREKSQVNVERFLGRVDGYGKRE